MAIDKTPEALQGLEQGLAVFSAEGQVGNVSGFVGPSVLWNINLCVDLQSCRNYRHRS